MKNSSPSEFDLDALFALARSTRVDTSRAEYAFETRLLPHLSTARGPTYGLLAWRLLPFFAAVVVALGAWQYELSSAASEARQAVSLQNPEAADLFATFQ